MDTATSASAGAGASAREPPIKCGPRTVHQQLPRTGALMLCLLLLLLLLSLACLIFYCFAFTCVCIWYRGQAEQLVVEMDSIEQEQIQVRSPAQNTHG